MNKRQNKKHAKKILKIYFDSLKSYAKNISFEIAEDGMSINSNYSIPMYVQTFKFDSNIEDGK